MVFSVGHSVGHSVGTLGPGGTTSGGRDPTDLRRAANAASITATRLLRSVELEILNDGELATVLVSAWVQGFGATCESTERAMTGP